MDHMARLREITLMLILLIFVAVCVSFIWCWNVKNRIWRTVGCFILNLALAYLAYICGISLGYNLGRSDALNEVNALKRDSTEQRSEVNH